jgi:sugar phosphate isomerase/epimerase
MEKGTVIGMEANPPIYNTNYINDTLSALELIKEVNSEGFKLNLDIGTMIENKEPVDELVGNVNMINHVHISEPNLKPIEKMTLHRELKNF